jgi:uncharacterized protein (TIGR02246 family)
MPGYDREELEAAHATFQRVSDACAASADYNDFADLFTEDCTYVEHVFGEMQGREAVRAWIVPLMRQFPNNQMTRYTHDWVYFDDDAGRIILCARTHMSDPGDGVSYTATNWTRLDYAGNGKFSREEDIYNPANFGKVIGAWLSARELASSS